MSFRRNKTSSRGRGRGRRGQQSSDHHYRSLKAPVKTELLASTAPEGKIKKGEEPVRVGSLHGLTQVGACMFIEYQDDIIMLDAAMEFSTESTLGADYIIPDISYIKKNKRKLRGILISHGHLDHIGALRDILPELGFPMVYTTPLTIGLIKKTFDDPKQAAKIKYTIVNPDTDIVKLGCFTVEFANVNHNIPETMAMAIHTPKGMIFTSSDFKIDHTPAIDKPADLAKIARFGAEGVKFFIGDALGSHIKGEAKSEQLIGESLDMLIKDAPGRIFVATFASNVGRVIQIVQSAMRYGRTVFITGRSMLNVTEICQQLGYITVPKGSIRKLNGNDIHTLPDNKALVLSTGAQGEEFAALTRIARGDHPHVELRKTDTVLLSSSTIPGNEAQMEEMLNNIVMSDVNLVTSSDMDIHASGHAHEAGHKLILALVRPQFFMPFYISARIRYAYRKIAMDMGLHEDRIMMPNENGNIIEIYDEVVRISPKKLRLQTVLIDGKGKGHLSGEYVIKARQIMAEHGMVSLLFKVDTKSRELVGNIQIESRGFVYSSEVRKIHTEIVKFARKCYNDNRRKHKEVKDNLKVIKDKLSEFINKIVGREPMIVPTYVYINRDAPTMSDVSDDDAIVGMTLDEQGIDG